MAALKYWLWLANLSALTNPTRLALLHRFGDPEEIYCADADALRLTPTMTAEQLTALEDKSLRTAEEIRAKCREENIRILTLQDGEYPARLKNIYDPPIVLYCKGRLIDLDEEAAVALVGTRDCTPYGISCARKLAHGLAKGGAVVVSGLAKGIDAEAADAALRAGGFPVGVLGNGVDVVYPTSSARLYEDLAAGGLLISEYPPGTRPAASHFPARNRLISALSLATVVVEAPEKSGALITAAAALEQGREVFAVPGPIDSPKSVGCNRLIRDGAGLAAEAWDILREYADRFPGKLSREEGEAPPRPAAPPPMEAAVRALPSYSLRRQGRGLTDDQITLLRILPAEGGAIIDDLAEESGLPVRRVFSALTVMEVDELVRQEAGKRYVRTVTLTE